MSNTPSLDPCPFCGGINIIHCGHHMYCHACGADGPDADSQHESEAIAAWNRRTPQPAPAPLSEREAFEAWIKKDGGDLGTFGTPPNMHYRNSAVNNAWVAWKARAALAAQGSKA